MNWLLFALLPPVLFASINHIDKHLIEKYIKGGGIGSLAIISALAGLPAFLIIGLFNPLVLNISLAIKGLIILNGALYVLSLIPYFYALNEDEASVVGTLFQLAPVFTYALGWIFLKETLSFSQILGVVIIMIGALWLTIEIEEVRGMKIKKRLLLLMVMASFLTALNGLIFKVAALETSFWQTAFWEYVGFFIAAIILLLGVSSYRREFLRVIKVNSSKVIGLNILNELLAVSAKTTLHLGTLLAPLALVYWVAESFQPFFLLIIGVLITKFFPNFGEEKLSHKHLLQKGTAIALMLCGAFIVA